MGERRAALGHVKAVDTNIVARFVLGDDPAQTMLATQLLRTPCYISDSVLLETAWLLSSRFGLDRPALAATLRDLIELPTVSVGDLEGLRWAIDRFAAGADLADMIHIHMARGADAFVSFEKQLAQRAGPNSPVPVETLG